MPATPARRVRLPPLPRTSTWPLHASGDRVSTPHRRMLQCVNRCTVGHADTVHTAGSAAAWLCKLLRGLVTAHRGLRTTHSHDRGGGKLPRRSSVGGCGGARCLSTESLPRQLSPYPSRPTSHPAQWALPVIRKGRTRSGAAVSGAKLCGKTRGFIL